MYIFIILLIILLLELKHLMTGKRESSIGLKTLSGLSSSIFQGQPIPSGKNLLPT